MTTGAPAAAGTAHDWLRRAARQRPRATAVTHWRDGAVRDVLDFAALDALVQLAAAALAARVREPGERVVLALPNDATFTAALLACLAAGLIAVPAPEPTDDPTPATAARLRGIVADCRPALVIGRGGPAGRAVGWDELIAGDDAPAPGPHRRAADGIALLQYTSGSTGTPKGAVLTHRAIAASCAQAAAAYGESPRDTAVTWVPLHHDMGLVTGVLRPLFSGYASVLMSPREFARTPVSWLRAITAARGTLSSAPDFAYGLCVRRVPAGQTGELDLSAWRVARNAGEVVRADTADRFTAHFRAAGFRADAFCPSYGMAEATLTVTASTPRQPPVRLAVDRDALRAGRVRPRPAEPAPATGPTSVLLSSGPPLPGTRVSIGPPDDPHDQHDPHDPHGRPDAGRVGPVWISGPQLFSGYWPARPDTGTGPGRWYPTGDLGFVHRGHLFVLGRADDTVVQNGRNVHASDIRAVCAGIPGLRPGRCVAFTLDAPGGPRVCLVAELRAGPAADDVRATDTLVREIRSRLAAELELYVHHVELVPAGELPVTTSGKPMVTETRTRFAGRVPSAR
ncbi:AMP-binding protein [Kitasatospora sp. NPDC093558]|uniref:AMP-binding protein n=1 Tax=Kitasatospora sp. NPDC093558 TaxID=3155201 RepID=UPI00341A52C3